uniref:NADH-ubiquinone oxidoreductase chain 6 n=1 Tax=Phylloecus linearis TaxID=2816400 RepID=A0A1W6Q593_9HYME|nr:NADH dehydrogenase subunit 6 [Phylloecus linearis]
MLMNMFLLINKFYMLNYLIIKILIIYLPIILAIIPLFHKSIHPVSMMIYLILFTIFNCLKMSILFLNSWFSYMLFLTMIGGLLILFLYFVATSSNEKIKSFKLNYFLIKITSMSIMMVIMSIMFYFDTFSILSIDNITNQSMFMKNNWSNINHFNSSQMFNLTYKITLIMMIYLLFTLFTLMKMCMKMYGPLRQYS